MLKRKGDDSDADSYASEAASDNPNDVDYTLENTDSEVSEVTEVEPEEEELECEEELEEEEEEEGDEEEQDEQEITNNKYKFGKYKGDIADFKKIVQGRVGSVFTTNVLRIALNQKE